jgi:sugar lactone lactonase YvrE
VIAGVLGACTFADGVGPQARFYQPAGMSRDAKNNVMYIADQTNFRIRAMDLTTYAVTTVVGSSVGFANGPFTTALLNWCTDVVYRATSEGDRWLYIADHRNNAIRKADLNTTMLSTLALTPLGINVVLSRSGALLFVASSSGTVLSIDATTGNVSTIAGADGTSRFP